MDNHAQDFARKIISILEDIKRLIHDAISLPHKKTTGSAHDKDEANESNDHSIVHSTSHTSHMNPAISEHTTTRQENSKCGKWLKDHGVEILGVIILGVYTTVNACQLGAMLESNRINREALISVQRAVIGFKEISSSRIVRYSATGQPSNWWRINVSLENAGATTGISTTQHFKGCILPSEPDETLFKGGPVDPSYRVSYVGPKAMLQTGAILKPESFFPVGQRTIPGNEKRVLWGWVYYRDIFANTEPHVTEYCDVLNGIGTAPNGTIAFAYDECERHNCTDKDCPDYGQIVEMVNKRVNVIQPVTPCP